MPSASRVWTTRESLPDRPYGSLPARTFGPFDGRRLARTFHVALCNLTAGVTGEGHKIMRGPLFRRVCGLLALAIPLALVPALSISQPASSATNTVVSLTFDDGQSSQVATQAMLASHGMNGTYYINSAQVGSSSYYMTWPQIHSLADAGNEIGGHTLHHVNLTTVNTATAQTEVCNDRQALLNQGFAPVTSFAYPEAAVNATARQIVQQCGYATGRGVGSIYSGGVCPDCPFAETIPPANAFDLRTPESAGSSTTLAQLQSYVTDAESNGGGWVVLTFHG